MKRAVLVLAVAGAFVGAAAPSALAACHAFSVAVSPSTVTEGRTVTVTVSRDGAVRPSSIHVSTVNGTAKAGTDYRPLDMTVSFTTDTERQFTVATIDDHTHESTESFSLHLSDPAGCFNGGYVVGPDAFVRIADNDAAPSPTHSATPTARATAEPTVAASTPSPTPAKPSPRASAPRPSSSAPEPSSSPSTVVAAGASAGTSSNALWIGAAIAVLLVGSATGFFFRRKKMNP